MTAQIRFDNRVAIITGAGNGLGRAYAIELARRGAKVVVNDLGGSGAGVGASHNAADAVVDAIKSAGGEALANYDSVSTRAGGAAIVQSALDAWGKVDICINNAGFLRNGRFEDLRDDQIDPILDVHVKGAFYVSQPAFRAMRANKYGRFLFTGSASAMFGHAWQANYAAGKGGLMGLSHIVAIEGSAHNIASNLLMPTAKTRLADEMDQGFMEIPAFAEAVRGADYTMASGRNVEDFNAALAVYLVSEHCRASHGIFSHNSGRYAQVHIAVGDGWVAPKGHTAPSVDDIAAHFDQITRLNTVHEPQSVYDEFTAAAKAARAQGIA